MMHSPRSRARRPASLRSMAVLVVSFSNELQHISAKRLHFSAQCAGQQLLQAWLRK